MAAYFPILLGTVRDERRSEWVAQFAAERLAARGHEVRVFDPREWMPGNLERREWEMHPRPERMAEYSREMTRADGFVVVSPEYNHGYPGALKNMLDVVYDEWGRKPFALVGVGGISGGLRMLGMLREVVAGLGAVSVPMTLPVQFVAKEFTADGPLAPETWGPRFDKLYAELEWYAAALKAARND